MSATLPGAPELTKRPFWSKPEGKTGLLFLAAAIGAGVFALNVFGPAVLAALTLAIALTNKAIVLGGLAVTAWLAFLLVTNKKVHTLVEVIFKTAMRRVTGWVIEIDPIAIMRTFIDDLKERRTVMAESIRKLNGQIAAVENKVADNESKAQNALELAKVARDRGNTAVMAVQSNQHGRLEKYTISLKDVLAKMRVLLQLLRKYYDASGAVIDDLTNEVNIQEDQRKMILSAYTAITAARDILLGEGDKREMFDMAMEITKDQFGQKVGEIEDFMSVSQSFIEGMDLQNGVFQEDALKKIAAWESKVDSLLLGDDKRQILEQHGTTTIPVFTAGQVDNGSSDYSKLFGGGSR